MHGEISLIYKMLTWKPHANGLNVDWKVVLKLILGIQFDEVD
jgi:hypothetical protein